MTAIAQVIVSEDRPRFGAVIITGAGTVLYFEQIESMQTDKSDNGDAGTWSIRTTLAINTFISGAIGPMDIVALYADRGSTDSLGNTTDSTLLINLLIPTATPLAYGSADANTTNLLGTDHCLMIGMVDSVAETFDYENATLELNIAGRDLTKIFIDNDTIVPATLPEGGGSGALAGLSSVVIKRLTSGTQLLLDVLDVFVTKNPNVVSSLLVAGQAAPLLNTEAAELAQYGYPWRRFVRADLLITGFQHLSSGQFNNYSVQMGSAWVNTNNIRNFPITRLFVNEVGALVFDDTWTAWGFGSSKMIAEGYGGLPIMVNRADVRKIDFRQSDDNLITALSITAAGMPAGDTALASLVTFGKQNVSPLPVLQRYGYRFQSFESYYDSTSAFLTSSVGGNAAANAAGVSIPSQIYNAAQQFKQTNSAPGSDRGLKGAPARNECCAAVESVLDLAGIPEIGDNPLSVPSFAAALPARGWVIVPQAQAVPGDFVILGDNDHIGIYEGNNLMISNGSTAGSFTWEASPAAQQAGCAAPGAPGPTFWHYVSATPAASTTPMVSNAFSPATNVLNARFPILWTLHNDLWTATFTLKGNNHWRAGQLLITDLGGTQDKTRPLPGRYKQWYILSVAHSLEWGADWTTTLQCRFPQDYPPVANSTEGGSGSGAIAAAGG
jgi:hypothetical protein